MENIRTNQEYKLNETENNRKVNAMLRTNQYTNNMNQNNVKNEELEKT